MKIQQGTMDDPPRGIPMQKNPFDLALYSLLLGRVRPRTLIEIGSYQGGSAIWFADQAQVLGLDIGIFSIDLSVPTGVAAPSVHFLEGDARSLRGALPDSFMSAIERPLLVVEDSSHMAGTTLSVLEFFDPWLRAGEYLVIEAGILCDSRVDVPYH